MTDKHKASITHDLSFFFFSTVFFSFPPSFRTRMRGGKKAKVEWESAAFGRWYLIRLWKLLRDAVNLASVWRWHQIKGMNSSCTWYMHRNRYLFTAGSVTDCWWIDDWRWSWRSKYKFCMLESTWRSWVDLQHRSGRAWAHILCMFLIFMIKVFVHIAVHPSILNPVNALTW